MAFLMVSAAACGAGDSDTVSTGDSDQTQDGTDVASEIDGRSFWSVAVTEDGQPRELVEGTRIQVSFRGGDISASAGCNSMGGPFRIEGEALFGDSYGMTEMGCDPLRHAQDEFVVSLLTSQPTISVEGDRLVISSASVTVELVDREVADPDRSVTGTRWNVTGFIQGDVATAMAVTTEGWIEIVDSTMRGNDGCADFEAPVEYSDGSTGGPVDGDGEMQFGPRDPEPRTDCPSQEYTDAFNELFATGDATIELRGPNITLLNRDGNGVTFRAAEQSG